MTNISVVSTLTTLAPSGTLQLGDYHVNQTTIGDVKRQVEEMANVSSSCQKLWWRGYLLSNDELPLTLACVGVNEGETIDTSLDKLVLFMTVDPPRREIMEENSPVSPQRRRSSSFDIVRMELVRQRNTISNSCVVL